jgi:hypothetical protein
MEREIYINITQIKREEKNRWLDWESNRGTLHH